MNQVMVVMHGAVGNRGQCSAGMHCLLSYGKQRMVTPTSTYFVATKASRGIIHHLANVVYLMYQVISSL